MAVAQRVARMTREEFLDWAEAQEGRYEFDGQQPVDMTGTTGGHNLITLNILRVLGNRLRGKPCRVLGIDVAIATVGERTRAPDALVTCTGFPSGVRIIPNPIIVFEVLSPTSMRTDRIDKLREYRLVPSIRRYIIVEYASIGLTVHFRSGGDQPWTTRELTEGESLDLPEIDETLPLADIYEGVSFDGLPEEG